MSDELELHQGKTMGELAAEALRFVLHVVVAVFALLVIVAVLQLLHTDPNASQPKYLVTGLALLVPLAAGFGMMRWRPDDEAAYIWVAGLLFFAILCVTVLGLPTGPGLCERCGATEKLGRTFFSIQHGSGLLGGDGVLVGWWMPMAIVGYAIGARLALPR